MPIGDSTLNHFFMKKHTFLKKTNFFGHLLEIYEATECFNLLENADLGSFLHLNLDPKVSRNLFFNRSVTVGIQKD